MGNYWEINGKWEIMGNNLDFSFLLRSSSSFLTFSLINITAHCTTVAPSFFTGSESDRTLIMNSQELQFHSNPLLKGRCCRCGAVEIHIPVSVFPCAICRGKVHLTCFHVADTCLFKKPIRTFKLPFVT